MATPHPRLFTIAPSTPFLPTLVEALLDGRLIEGYPGSDDPLALADATLYLPTRRACRLAQDVFRAALKSDSAILPRIVPIGDIDEDEIIFSEIAAGALAEDALALPRAIEPFERKAILAQLILAWARTEEKHGTTESTLIAHSPAAAYAMAGELARLQDDMITRKVAWSDLDTLVPTEMDTYFEATLKFLKIAREYWPALLAERQAIDAAERRDRLIALETARLQRPGSGPVIAAGSTGSMPSTATLLSAIASLPQGAVVLPGLDLDLDAEGWAAIGDDLSAPAPGHPQFSMHALLQRRQVTREDVIALGARPELGREPVLSEAMRPASVTDRWQLRLAEPRFTAARAAALTGLTLMAAAHPEEEALAIAIALREAVDDGTTDSLTRTAALITPDRALARRVLTALARWNVPVDDSGGDALSDTQTGIFARLAAEVALGGCEPVSLLALLKHPLCRLGAESFALLPAIHTLELAILRGPRPQPGTDGLHHALQTFRAGRENLHRSDPRRDISDSNLDRADDLVTRLSAALQPLARIKKALPLSEFTALHEAVMDALARGEKEEFANRLQDDRAALRDLFETVAQTADAASLTVMPQDYPDLFHSLAAERMVRRPGAPGARVRIYGPLEARLQDTDRVVLASLVEGVWPPEPRSDPWLNRPMRHDLGLDLPERRIGLSAHDFAQALGARDVFLSYPAKRDGAPTVISRFVQRMAAVCGKDEWSAVKKRGDIYLGWARRLDKPEEIAPIARPAPSPPLEARPKRLSVTEIEHWLRDPYTIYARHVLKLAALDPVNTQPGARDRGTAIHQALGDFTSKFAAGLPANPYDELITLGKAAFAKLADYPEATAFWWPRFERIARWFVDWESERRANISAVYAETFGKLAVTPDFLLTARADRIELLNDGTFAVLDYKTGQPPSAKEVRIGLAPQLTLQAAMLKHGTFEGVPAGHPVSTLMYLRLNGGNPGGSEEPRNFEDVSVNDAADKTLEDLRMVVARFAAGEPYRSFVRPQWVGRTYSDFDHLARVKEWSATGGASDEGDGE
jgi:ATP-dependent helicase/nuclease subunit B